MRPVALLLAGSALCSALSGCMVGPDFKRPSPPKTEAYLSSDPPTDLVAGGIPGGEAQSSSNSVSGRAYSVTVYLNLTYFKSDSPPASPIPAHTCRLAPAVLRGSRIQQFGLPP